MAGLLEALLGKENPLAQWAGDNQNYLGALGAGLAAGPTFSKGVASGLSMAPQGKLLDQQAAAAREEKTQQQLQQNATRDLLTKEAPDLAQLLDTGIPMGEVWGEYLRRKQPQGGKAENPFMSAGDGNFFNWQTGEYVTNPNAPPAPAVDQPASVKEYQFAVSQGYDKDFQSFIQEKGRNAGTPPAGIANEIFQADEGAQAGQNVVSALDKALELNTTAWDGPWADVGSSTTAFLGKPEDPTTKQAVQTQELKNLVTANALESLRATFGGNPTEGERKILLEVQGSINQPRAVREAIFKRAKAAALRRMQFNKERGSALRSGTYFDAGYSPVGGNTGSQTSTGIPWSVEP